MTQTMKMPSKTYVRKKVTAMCIDCGQQRLVDKAKAKVAMPKRCQTCNYKATKSVRHGEKGIRFYRIWQNMLNRCRNANVPTYKYYGGRGIKVCERWTIYENFKEDMQTTYQDNLTIDRIDVNGDYEPSNCRWVTMKVQNNNKRSQGNRYKILSHYEKPSEYER